MACDLVASRETLYHYYRDAAARPLTEVLSFARQVLLGLQQAGTRGWSGPVHGDLKPANLLLKDSGAGAASDELTVRVADWGLAKDMGADPSESHHEFATIESAEPGLLDPQPKLRVHILDDLFSLGAIIWWCLVGYAPGPRACAGRRMTPRRGCGIGTSTTSLWLARSCPRCTPSRPRSLVTSAISFTGFWLRRARRGPRRSDRATCRCPTVATTSRSALDRVRDAIAVVRKLEEDQRQVIMIQPAELARAIGDYGQGRGPQAYSPTGDPSSSASRFPPALSSPRPRRAAPPITASLAALPRLVASRRPRAAIRGAAPDETRQLA